MKRWLRRGLVGLGVLAMLVGFLAYGYQPAEQLRPGASADSRFVETRTARFHYLQRGSGDPVVLLSPGASPASAWGQQFEVLARTHAVYVVDLPGQGETELRIDSFDFDLEGMTRALGEFLDVVGLRQVVLAGNSWSGGWGLAYAQRHPERVSKLMLLAPSGLAERDPWAWELLKVPVAGEILAKVGTSRSMVESTLRGLFVHQELVTPELVDRAWRPSTYRDNVRALYALERGLDWRETEDRLPQTRQPVLVLWGDQDSILPVRQAERFGQLLPKATVRVLPGCGHLLMLDCADPVTAAMTAFVR